MTVVCLRIVIGWHFFKEGTNKLHSGDFNAAPVVKQAKGELAPLFKKHAPDDDAALAFIYQYYDSETETMQYEPPEDADEDENEWFELAAKEPAADWWEFGEDVRRYYDFGSEEVADKLKDRRTSIKDKVYEVKMARDAARRRIDEKRRLDTLAIDQDLDTDDDAKLEALAKTENEDIATYEQAAKEYQEVEARYKDLLVQIERVRDQPELTNACLDKWELTLQTHLQANEAAFVEYFQEKVRLEKYQNEAARTEVSTRNRQLQTIQVTAAKKRAPLVSSLDTIWESVEDDLVGLAVDYQRERAGLPPEIPKPTDISDELKTLNNVIPWFDTIVGALLVLGLFTRVAAIAGAAFLTSVIAMQLPWAAEAVPTYYQSVELFALLALAALGAGRFAGLDFYLRCFFYKVFAPGPAVERAQFWPRKLAMNLTPEQRETGRDNYYRAVTSHTTTKTSRDASSWRTLRPRGPSVRSRRGCDVLRLPQAQEACADRHHRHGR